MRQTHNNPISQGQIDFLEYSPEGFYFAPAGFFIVDRLHGRGYFKTTGPEFNTGWAAFAIGVPGASSAGAAFVDTFDLVRTSVNPANYAAAVAFGYAAPTDGVFRVFRWNAGDTRDDDDSTILDSDFDPDGRWNQVL